MVQHRGHAALLGRGNGDVEHAAGAPEGLLEGQLANVVADAALEHVDVEEVALLGEAPEATDQRHPPARRAGRDVRAGQQDRDDKGRGATDNRGQRIRTHRRRGRRLARGRREGG